MTGEARYEFVSRGYIHVGLLQEAESGQVDMLL